MNIPASIFKAYDIRGIYPSEINEKVVFEIAKKLAARWGSKSGIVIGHDARLSSPSLYAALVAGLSQNGAAVKVIPAGAMTTPMLYFLVNQKKAAGGIMVTASHNPKEFNGLKVVGTNARPMSGTEIFELMENDAKKPFQEKSIPSPAGVSLTELPAHMEQVDLEKSVMWKKGRDEVGAYVNFLKKFLKPKRKMRVVFDCSDGATGMVLDELFGSHPLVRSTLINAWPNGHFPAHGPNPLAKGAARQLVREVRRQKADLGVIFDADGDRVFFVDNRGREIDPNEAGYMLAQVFRPPYVVGEVSSWRLKKLKAKSVKRKTVFISRVGHYFFKKLMRAKRASLGLEHSGHFYFRDFFYCDSGILASIEVINFISRLPGGVAEWLDALPAYYRSGEINFKVADKENILRKIESAYKKDAIAMSKSDGLTMELEGYWFNVRPSNTENLLRLNLEATGKEILKRELKKIKSMI